MQRVSDGLAVPKLMLDTFDLFTTDAVGEITCNLTYTPKSLHHIIIPPIWIGANVFVRGMPQSLTGKALTVRCYQDKYYKSDVVSGASNSGNAGADAHTHPIGLTLSELDGVLYTNKVLDVVRVNYTVA